MSRKDYFKDYFQRPEVKQANAERMKDTYYTEDGQAYEHMKRRTARSRYARAIYGAKRRKKAWDIPFEVYADIITRNCFHCNSTTVPNETGSGLDRIDNERGYHSDNVQACCKDCNRRRGRQMGSDEFKRQTKLNKRWQGD